MKAWTLIGKNYFFRNSGELKNRKFQRSIYVIKKIKIGEKFSIKNIKRIRPGYSLPADKWEFILNKISKKNYSIGSRILLKDF